MFTRLGAKRLELLRELIPDVSSAAALINPTNPTPGPQLKDLQTAAHTLGVQLISVGASNEQEIESVLSTLAQNRIGALVITADGFLNQSAGSTRHFARSPSRDTHDVPMAPPVYRRWENRLSMALTFLTVFANAASTSERSRGQRDQLDLPVLQPSTYEFVINLKTK